MNRSKLMFATALLIASSATAQTPTIEQARAAADLLKAYLAPVVVPPSPTYTFPLAPVEARNYKITFAEEFTNQITIRPEGFTSSANTWNLQYWYGWPGQYSAHDDYANDTMTSKAWNGDDVHQQANGVVSLVGNKRPATGTAAKYGTHPYIGAIMQTSKDLNVSVNGAWVQNKDIGGFEQTYGYYEVRLKATALQGYWPAFWLWSKKNNGEIDIFEGQTTEPGNVYMSTHVRTIMNADGTYTALAPDKQIHTTDRVGADTMPGFKIADWHTYGFLWTKDSLSWFIDGVKKKSVPNTVFHAPMFLILSNGPGGWSTANNNATVFPGKFDVDYIRVGAF